MSKWQSNSFTNWNYPSSIIKTQTNKIIFKETRVDLDKNKYESKLNLLENNNISNLTQYYSDNIITTLDNGEILLTSPDRKIDNQILNKTKSCYTKDIKDENWTHLFSLTPGNGEPTHKYSLPITVSCIFETNNKDLLIIIGDEFQDKKDYREIEHAPWWFNGVGYIENNKPRLYLFNKKDNKLSIIYDKNLVFHGFSNEEHSKMLLLTGSPDTINDLYSTLHLFDLDKFINLIENNKNNNISEIFSSCFSVVSEKELSIHNILFSNENECFILATDMKTFGLNESPDLYYLNLNNNNLDKLTDLDNFGDYYNVIGSDAKLGGGNLDLVYKNKLYAVFTKENKTNIVSFDKFGKSEDILKGENLSITSFNILDDEVIFTAISNKKLTEIYSYNMKNQKLNILSNYSEDLSESVFDMDSFTFESNGDTLIGYVIKPKIEKDKKYPMLLEVHGGPRTAFGTTLFHEMQLLAEKGFFVVFTNPHGSSGFGDKFADIRGRYGEEDFKDLMNFVDEVLSRYEQIDQNKLGVLGGSYGGFMTNYIIGNTNRFKAACTQRSISNWLSFYGTSDIGPYFAEDQTQSSIFNNVQLALKQSPITYVNNITTPLLVIHSDCDFRCPLEQGTQMFTALKKKNIDTRMVIFHNENHELSRSGKPKNRIKRLDEITSWFEKYLK